MSADRSQGRTRDAGRAWRTPAIVLLVGLLVGALVVGVRGAGGDGSTVTATDLTRLMPVATPADAPSSTWFCAGGTARGSTDRATGPDARTTIVAEHWVAVGNPTTADRTVRVTAYGEEGEPVAREVPLRAGQRTEVRAADLVQSPFASVLVEADGGGLIVDHSVEGPTGRSSAPCATSPSTSWYFPSGDTRLGTRTVFVVFNPFPDPANLDFSFETGDVVTGPPGTSPGAVVPGATSTAPGGTTPPGTASRRRESEKFKGVVVPARAALAVDITDVITVRSQISTTIEAKAGRVVVDELIVADPTGGPSSLVLTPGAPRTSDTWLFGTAAPLEEGIDQQYVIYNPGEGTADVSVGVVPDVAGPDRIVDPFELQVRARSFGVVSLAQDERVPRGSGAWVSVRSLGAAVVVARVTRAVDPVTPAGTTVTLGSPLVAREWQVPTVGGAAGRRGEVAVANPSAGETVTVTVLGWQDGEARPVQGFDGVAVRPGGRIGVSLDELSRRGDAPEMLSVRATSAVVVERRAAGNAAGTRSDAIAAPVDGTLALPPADLYDPANDGDLGPGTVLTPDTVIGGTVPGPDTGGTLPFDTVPFETIETLPAPSTVPPETVPPESIPPETGPDGLPLSTTTTATPPAVGPGQ